MALAPSLAEISQEQGRLADALAIVHEATSNLANFRRLQVEQCTDNIDWNDAHNVAQIIQGVMFITLAMWLIFANNSKVAVAQKAPLEQRHAVCATISTAVALFSGFFNILQLTAIDDFDIPGRPTGGFQLQLARPVEWVMTCPILQLKLVVLAGARVPSYRRFMMPLLSAATLLSGVAATFTDSALRYVWFVFGCIFCIIMFYHNILRISENSEGEESWSHGDSDFRRLSLLLIITWFPFPIWYTLSPEGFNLVTEELVIELGWVVLNILAKFSLIILMQRMKMVHQRKLEAARELYGLSPTDEVPEDMLNKKAIEQSGGNGRASMQPEDYGLGMGEEADSEAKLVELVADSMVTLGMPNHTERLLKLLVESGVTNTSVLERLNRDRCMELCLPWALVDAVQRRWTNEKMNMGQDQGGVVEKEDPFLKMLEANKERVSSAKTIPLGMVQSGGALMDLGALDEQIAAAVRKAVLPLHETVMTKLHALEDSVSHSLESTQDSVAQRMDFGQVTLMQSVNACQVLLHKLDSSQEVVLQKLDGHKTALENMTTSYSSLNSTVTGAQDTTRQALMETVSSSSSALLQKLDSTQQDLLRQSQSSHTLLQNVSAAQGTLAQKVDAGSDSTTRRLMELEKSMEHKLGEVVDGISASTTVANETAFESLKEDLHAVSDQTNATVVAAERSAALLDERMADMRRQTIMIMDLLTTTSETIQQSSETLQSMKFSGSDLALKEAIAEQLGGPGNLPTTAAAEGLPAAVDDMVARLETSAQRLEKADMEEAVKREFAAVGIALAQQQRETSDSMHDELSALKDLHLKGLEEKMAELAQNVARFEANMEAKLAPYASPSSLGPPGPPSSASTRRRSERSERG